MENMIIYNQDVNRFLPKISMYFDKGIFEIENAIYDYREKISYHMTPFFYHLNRYFQNVKPQTSLIYKVTYFNSDGLECIKNILRVFEDYQKKLNVNMDVKWYYPIDDLDIKLEGEELMKTTKLNFQILPMEEVD